MNSRYKGEELDLFKNAGNWKRYLLKIVKPYLHGRVLEVGAGIGTNTAYLSHHRFDQWLCLEPDIRLARRISRLIGNRQPPLCCSVVAGTTASLRSSAVFDSIIYIDVLEHIRDDGEELQRACFHLTEGGFLVVVAPAHNRLFSEFDKAVGHFRRYSLSSLKRIGPKGMRIHTGRYVDSLGTLASLCNRMLLRNAAPGNSQLAFWDKVVVPVSRLFDPLFGNRVGKTLMMVWKKV